MGRRRNDGGGRGDERKGRQGRGGDSSDSLGGRGSSGRGLYETTKVKDEGLSTPGSQGGGPKSGGGDRGCGRRYNNQPRTPQHQSSNSNSNSNNGTPSSESTNTPGTGGGQGRSGGKKWFVAHQTLDQTQALFAEGKVVKGSFRGLANSRRGAYVTPEAGGGDIYIDGDRSRNRAMDGDTVYVALEAGATADDGRLSEAVLKLDLNAEDESGEEAAAAVEMNKGKEEEEERVMWQDDVVQASLWAPQYNTERIAPRTNLAAATGEDKKEKVQRRGRIVFIDKSQSKAVTLIGTIKPWSYSFGSQHNKGPQKDEPKPNDEGNITVTNGERLLFIPRSQKHPFFLLPRNLTHYSPKSLYRSEYDPKTGFEWSETDRFPRLKRTMKFGESFDIEAETMALLFENDVNHSPSFSSDVVKGVEAAVMNGLTSGGEQWVPPKGDLVGRRDFRDECVFTIDPTTAKDLDDALHIKVLPNGEGVEVGVHIADVSHFLKTDTPVDIEARHRATTVYLVDRVLTMLPRPLCEIACSLNENVERLVFSCVWRMKMDGEWGVDEEGGGGAKAMWRMTSKGRQNTMKICQIQNTATKSYT